MDDNVTGITELH